MVCWPGAAPGLMMTRVVPPPAPPVTGWMPLFSKSLMVLSSWLQAGTQAEGGEGGVEALHERCHQATALKANHSGVSPEQAGSAAQHEHAAHRGVAEAVLHVEGGDRRKRRRRSDASMHECGVPMGGHAIPACGGIVQGVGWRRSDAGGQHEGAKRRGGHGVSTWLHRSRLEVACPVPGLTLMLNFWVSAERSDAYQHGAMMGQTAEGRRRSMGARWRRWGGSGWCRRPVSAIRIYRRSASAASITSELTEADHAAAHAVVAARRLGNVTGCKSTRESENERAKWICTTVKGACHSAAEKWRKQATSCWSSQACSVAHIGCAPRVSPSRGCQFGDTKRHSSPAQHEQHRARTCTCRSHRGRRSSRKGLQKRKWGQDNAHEELCSSIREAFTTTTTEMRPQNLQALHAFFCPAPPC